MIRKKKGRKIKKNPRSGGPIKIKDRR